MSQRTRQGWQLARHSWAVLRANKSLLVFPFCCIVLCLGLLLLFARPLWHIEQTYFFQMPQAHAKHAFGLLMLILAVYFFITHFIMVFTNSALMICARDYFENKPVSVWVGLRSASRHFFNLFMWTVIATTIGCGIRLIEAWSDEWEKNEMVQTYLGGMGWMFATYFIVPVLLFENRDPFVAMRRSSFLMLNTWGKAVRANFGLTGLSMMLRMLSLIPFAISIMIGGHNTLVVGGCISVFFWLLVSLWSSAIYMVLRGALYEFATRETVAHFEAVSLEKAFKTAK